MFCNRARYYNGTRLLHSRDRRSAVERQEGVGWMLMVVLAAANILSFSLLWLKADGGCARHPALCNSAAYILTDITSSLSSAGAPAF
jgi:hypothetical protein